VIDKETSNPRNEDPQKEAAGLLTHAAYEEVILGDQRGTDRMRENKEDCNT
jgi:hypothetical protein